MESSKPPSQRKQLLEKKSFQWSTPADEFAEDVGSDVEEDENESLKEEDDMEDDESDDDPLRHDLPPEDEEDMEGENEFGVDGETGGIIINLGVEEADKFATSSSGGTTTATTTMTTAGPAEATSPRSSRRRSEPRGPKHKYPCPKCNKEWNWPWELRRHIVTHYKEKERHETSAYKCEDCGKGFQWKRDLAQHRRLHTGEKLLVCSVCEKKFTTRQALLHHVVVHTGEKPFQCAFCGNKFTQPANLRTHMKKKHGELNIKGNKCPHCGEAFQSIISVHQHVLEDHQNVVAESREAAELVRIKKENEKVEKERQKQDNRKRRMQEKMIAAATGGRVSSSKPRVNEWEIEYEFQLGEGLVRGVDWDRTPSNGELSCDHCERKFGWRYEVMFHGLCHLVDEEGKPKNKICPECDTAFKVPIGLKHHLVIHTGETPFLCLHCWKSFSSHIDLKLHIRKEHLVHLMPTPEPKNSKTSKPSSSGGKNARSSSSKAKTQEDSKQSAKPEIKDLQIGNVREGVIQEEKTEEESVTVVVQEDEGNDETQTIVIGGDQMADNQDMIVIVQSGDFDQSQGLIVVDPSQIQQINGVSQLQVQQKQEDRGTEENGRLRQQTQQQVVEEVTPQTSQEQQYIKLQMPENNDETTTVVLTEDGTIQGHENASYVVMQDSSQIQIQQPDESSAEQILSTTSEEDSKAVFHREQTETAHESITVEGEEAHHTMDTEEPPAEDKKAL